MTPHSGNMTVELEGRGPLIIRPNDYVRQGGEGVIYRLNQTVVKIYHDPDAVRRGGMAEKIKILGRLVHPYIVAPQGCVAGAAGKFIGFYMPYVNGEPLPRTFTNDFRMRAGFGDERAKRLAERMRETIQFAHDNGAVLVDANELNWFVILPGSNGPEPRVIDVDSWAIGRWPAKVIMPSIRDWHTAGFNQLTDWFAWGVVTFQILTGIHPYKGTLAGYKRGDIEARMKANASVFSANVAFSHAVRDFSCIPSPLLDWYQSIFQKGERSIPPSPYASGVGVAPAARVMRVVVKATGALVFDELFHDANDPALRVFPSGIVMLVSRRLVDLLTKHAVATVQSRKAEVVRVGEGWLVADWVLGELHFSFVDERTCSAESLSIALRGHGLVRYENRLFVVTENELVELGFKYLGKPLLSVSQRIQILRPKAAQWFNGVGVEEALGAKFLIAPFGDSSSATVRVRELDGLTPVAAKAGEHFAAVVAVDKSGAYRRFNFAFDRDYRAYQVAKSDADGPDLNLTILPRGVCATITDDGEMIVFVPSSGAIKRVEDQAIKADMLLARWDDKVVYIHEGRVWSVRMK